MLPITHLHLELDKAVEGVEKHNATRKYKLQISLWCVD